MAANRNFLDSTSSGYGGVRTDSTYRDTSVTLATIEAAGYLNPLWFDLQRTGVLRVFASDGVREYTVACSSGATRVVTLTAVDQAQSLSAITAYLGTNPAAFQKLGVEGVSRVQITPLNVFFFAESVGGTVVICNDAALGFSPNGGGADTRVSRDALGVLRVNLPSDGSTATLQHNERVVADADGAVLTAVDSGKTYTNEGATGEANFTLPSAAAGMVFWFICQDADGIKATAATGDTIRVVGSVTSTAGNVASTTVGSAIKLKAINATEWIAEYASGTWVVSA